MKGSKASRPWPVIGRRDFFKAGAVAGAVMAILDTRAAAQAREVPAWDARPSNPRAIRPVSIDVHMHRAPETYVKAQAELGRPVNANRNPPAFSS